MFNQREYQKEWRRNHRDKIRVKDRERHTKSYNQPHGRSTVLLKTAKARAVRKQMPCTLSLKWIEDKLIVGKCELTGVEFEYTSRYGPYSPSIDRKDSTKGYVEDNCRVILFCMNTAFGSWGADAFEKAARAWLRYEG